MVENAPALFELFQFVVVSSWRATVVALLILAVLCCLRPRLSRRSHMLLWSLVVVRLVVPWQISSPWSLFNALDVPVSWRAHDTGHDPSTAGRVRVWDSSSARRAEAQAIVLPGAVAGQTTTIEGDPWFPAERIWALLTAAWLLGAASLVLVTAVTVVRFRRRLADGSLPSADVLSLLGECRQILGMKRSVRLVVSDAVATPAVSGLWRPTLMIPPAVMGGVDRAQLRLILLHELIHVQRGDVWWNWLTTALRIAHWFNPVLRLAFDRFDRERELCCDQRVLRVVGVHESRRYAQTLLNVLELCQHRLVARSPVPAGITGMADGLTSSHALAERMSHMLEISKKRHAEWKLGLAVALLLATVSLTQGEETPPPPKPETQEAAAPPPRPWRILPQPMLPAEAQKEAADAAAAEEQAKALEGPLIVISFDMARLLAPRHDTHFERPAFTRDQIEAIVRREAGPKGWDEEQHTLVWSGDDQRQLIVRHTQPIVKRIEDAVSYADKYGTSRVLLELEIYNGSAPALDAILPSAGQIDGEIKLVVDDTTEVQRLTHTVLTAEKAAALQEKLRSAKGVDLLAIPKLMSLWEQDSSIGTGTQRPFVIAFEKKGDQHTPVIEVFDEGIFATVHCVPRKGGNIQLDLEVSHTEILRVMTAPTEHGNVQIPTYSKAMVRTTAEVPNEQFLVLQSPRSKTGKSMQALILLIRPVVIDGEAPR